MTKQATVERDGAKRKGPGPVVPTTPEERAVYDSAKAAQEQRPTRRPKWRLYTVIDAAGRQRFTWAGWKELAVFRIALADGYTVSDPGRVPSKDKVAGLLAALSPEDRAALLATYVGKRGK